VGYSDAEVEPLAQRLVSQLPGLDIRLARVWIKSESGVNGNPLGVTHVENGVSKLNTYATREEGIDAAAALVKRSNNYAGIRSAIAGGNLRQQALALIASPWNARNSPYYTRVFTAAGLLGATPPAATGEYATKFNTLLKNLGISTDPSHVITSGEAQKIVASFGTVFGGGARPTSGNFTGRTVGDVAGTLQTSGQAIADAPGAIASVPGQVVAGITDPITGLADTGVQVATYMAALFLVGLGVFLYSKGGRGQEVVVASPA
jgi:hypothetical protein